MPDLHNQKQSPAFAPADCTRREALRRVLACGLVAATLPVSVVSTAQTAAPVTREFVPENDYPFFGYEPEPIGCRGIGEGGKAVQHWEC
jgi:hypothetical protein